MSWTDSLIKLSGYEVETLQKRLREVADRRMAVEMMLESLDREEAEEVKRGQDFAQAGWYLIGFRDGCRARRQKLQADLAAIDMEAQGVRDALGEAFEAQKKYEQVAERAQVAKRVAADRRDAAQLDELALRRTAG